MFLRSQSRRDEILAMLLVGFGFLFRVLPHPDNFAPIGAIAIFAGTVLPPSLALTVPVAAMIASDLWIGPHALYLWTWGAFVAASLIGVAVRRRPTPFVAAGGTVAGSLLFFIVSNAGVFWAGGLYERSAAGLRDCFIAALPFYRNTLLGDLLFAAALFGLYALASRALAGNQAGSRAA